MDRNTGFARPRSIAILIDPGASDDRRATFALTTLSGEPSRPPGAAYGRPSEKFVSTPFSIPGGSWSLILERTRVYARWHQFGSRLNVAEGPAAVALPPLDVGAPPTV